MSHWKNHYLSGCQKLFSVARAGIVKYCCASFPELPPGLSEINSLRNLSFSQPQRAGTGRLAGLTKLEWISESITVPEEITRLTKLKELHLSGVSDAPAHLLNFPNLEWLKFEVVAFPKKFTFVHRNVPNLIELNTTYPAAFVSALADLKNLKKLTLKGKVTGPMWRR
jgi:hypothetical protein